MTDRANCGAGLTVLPMTPKWSPMILTGGA
jgi:hypothetical protein